MAGSRLCASGWAWAIIGDPREHSHLLCKYGQAWFSTGAPGWAEAGPLQSTPGHQELLPSLLSLLNRSPFSPPLHHLLPKNPHIMENPEEVFLEKGVLKIYYDAPLTLQYSPADLGVCMTPDGWFRSQSQAICALSCGPGAAPVRSGFSLQGRSLSCHLSRAKGGCSASHLSCPSSTLAETQFPFLSVPGWAFGGLAQA